MSRRVRQNLGFLAVLALIAAAGVLAAVGVLLHERLPNPFADTYDVSAELAAADGVVPGYGQPVNVAGVPVGVIARARLRDGVALITMAIERSKLPRVFGDATVALEPVTPLKDMELDLVPGHPRAGALAAGTVIPPARTTSPAELEDLLGALDGDTRSFLASLISSLGTGTTGEGSDLRHMLLALGPTAAQLHAITSALASRRSEIARLVHNLAIVTRAASQDGELADAVQAGDATLHAVASQDAALRASIALLPRTLQSATTALGDAGGLAQAAGPALSALLPTVHRLPAALHALGPFAERTAGALEGQLRPFVREAQAPLIALAPAAVKLTTLTPRLSSVVKVLTYALNELSYDPGNGDPGMLFWLDWAAHNVDSAAGNEDAHGSIARSLVLASCQQIMSVENLGAVIAAELGIASVCKP